MRCFISINLPDHIKDSLSHLITGLRATGSDIKWVTPENIHLTLKFLGETDEKTLIGLQEALEKKIASYQPFCIKIAGIGCFPSARRPRVIWIGVEDSGALLGLARAVDESAAVFGFQPEARAFSPHLTVGRVRSERRLAEAFKVLEGHASTDFGTVEVAAIYIMKSELKPAGAEHRSLARISLAKED